MKREELEEILKEADMVLVGIGEEFSRVDELRQDRSYEKICEMTARAGTHWTVPCLNRSYLKKDKKLLEAYQKLGTLLKNKNYFVITTCMDGLIEKAGLREDRITTPCGSYDKLQCSEGCTGSVVSAEHTFLEELEAALIGKKAWDTMMIPKCKCGAPMECNTLYAEHYLEEGYAESWRTYMKWLQGTLNRRLCILELGADMMFAGVLRFRFEKMVSLNQQAKLLRVHSHLCQLPEALSGRGMSILQNAVDFMAEI